MHCAGPPVLQPNGNAPPDQAVTGDVAPKADKKAAKKKGKQAGLIVGKGTGHLLSALAAAASGVSGEAAESISAGPEDSLVWSLLQSSSASDLSKASQVGMCVSVQRQGTRPAFCKQEAFWEREGC